MAEKKHILISGSHRSGSTWIGTIIALSSEVNYIYEPFNIGFKRYWAPLRYWFEYVAIDDDPERQKIFLQYMHRFVKGTPKGFISDIAHIKSYGEAKEITKRYISFFTQKRQLLKDPIAVMSIDWLTTNFNLDVILCIRHPAAFAASLKVKNWTFDFQWFGKQTKLINTKLAPYKEQIRKMSANEHNIIDQAILLWNMIHYRILSYQEKQKEWFFIKHEDISRNPVQEFSILYDKLNLTFTEEIANKIRRMSETSETGGLKRNSVENISSWKDKLKTEEIERIKIGTQEIANHYYSQDEW